MRPFRVVPFLLAFLLALPFLSRAATSSDPYQAAVTHQDGDSYSQAVSGQAVCPGSPVPSGWLVVDFYYSGSSGCFPMHSFNVWIIDNLAAKPVGTVIDVCYDYNRAVPEGWEFRGRLQSSTQCGRPLYLTYYNVVRLQRVSGPVPPVQPVSPVGYFDSASCTNLRGWVWDPSKPNTPLNVDILSDGNLVAQVVADQYRADLQSSGKGDGRHGFDIPVPKSVLDNLTHNIAVRATGTNYTLQWSPRAIQCPNPIDGQSFFVRQQYLDFLGREPDQAGLNYWTSNITNCGSDAACIDYMRVETSKAFFLSIEFQETGYLIHRLFKASYGRVPTILEFFADKATISNGVVVGASGWDQKLESNKQAFVNSWVQRSSFRNLYDHLTNAQYVDQLFVNAQVTPDATFRSNLIASLDNGTATRATALRQVVGYQAFIDREFNPAFVLMQYFGYLRRNPNDAPDNNMDGYNFWLGQLNQYNNQNSMVKAFITSIEYRGRFGKP